MTSEFLLVAEAVLRNSGCALSAKAIVDRAIEEGLFSDRVSGKTPHQTMKSKLSVDIRRRGSQSIFARTQPGKFSLRESIDPQEIYAAKPYERTPDRSDVRVFEAARLDKLGRFQGIKRRWKKIFAATGTGQRR